MRASQDVTHERTRRDLLFDGIITRYPGRMNTKVHVTDAISADDLYLAGDGYW